MVETLQITIAIDGGIAYREVKQYAIDHGPWGFNKGPRSVAQEMPKRRDWAYGERR
jgi:hypothetical protein